MVVLIVPDPIDWPFINNYSMKNVRVHSLKLFSCNNWLQYVHIGLLEGNLKVHNYTGTLPAINQLCITTITAAYAKEQCWTSLRCSAKIHQNTSSVTTWPIYRPQKRSLALLFSCNGIMNWKSLPFVHLPWKWRLKKLQPNCTTHNPLPCMV